MVDTLYLDQDNISGLYRDVGPCSYGDADIGLGQGWRVVDTVPYHGDLHALLLELFYFLHFVRGQHFCKHLMYTNL